jgi:hypothetical protein
MEKPAIHFDEVVRTHDSIFAPILEAARGHTRPLEEFLVKAQEAFPALHATTLAAVRYFAEGQRVFVVGPRLQRLLLDTDCHAVPERFLKLPFPCFYIAVPDAKLEVYGDARTKMHKVGGMYVFQQTATTLVIIVWGKPNHLSSVIGDDAIFWIKLDLNRITRTETNGVALLDVETYVKTLVEDRRAMTNDAAVHLPLAAFDQTIRDVPLLARLVFNLLLYVSTKSAELDTTDYGKAVREQTAAAEADLSRKKSSGKIKKAQRKIAKKIAGQSSAVVTWLGRSYEKAPDDGAEPPKDSQGSGGGWSVRRGHFHHFWTGKRVLPDGTRQLGEELTLRWVLPVYRNLDVDPAAPAHEYRFVGDR